MKKIEVLINGAHEEEIGHEILAGIYGAVQNHGYTDVSVKADTLIDRKKDGLEIPEFLQNGRRGSLGQELKAAGR